MAPSLPLPSRVTALRGAISDPALQDPGFRRGLASSMHAWCGSWLPRRPEVGSYLLPFHAATCSARFSEEVSVPAIVERSSCGILVSLTTVSRCSGLETLTTQGQSSNGDGQFTVSILACRSVSVTSGHSVHRTRTAFRLPVILPWCSMQPWRSHPLMHVDSSGRGMARRGASFVLLTNEAFCRCCQSCKRIYTHR